MLCGWFALGLIKEELVEEGKEEMANHREREWQSIRRQSIVERKASEYRVYYVLLLLLFVFFFFFF